MMKLPSASCSSSTLGEKKRTGRKGAFKTASRSLSVLNERSLIEEMCCRKGCAKLLLHVRGYFLCRYEPYGATDESSRGSVTKGAGKRGERLPIDVYDEPGHLIRRAQQIAVSMFHSTMRNGVTPIQYCVLRVLQDHPGIDQVTLARLCALDTSTAADLAVRLEERGLVRRMMPMKSRRYRVLHITPDGEAKLKQLIPSASVLSRRLLQELDKQEHRAAEDCQTLSMSRRTIYLSAIERHVSLDVYAAEPAMTDAAFIAAARAVAARVYPDMIVRLLA